MDSIDKKINKSANDNLDGLESSLNHMDIIDLEEFQIEAKDMIDDCSKEEIKKVLQLLIKIARKSLGEEND
jgi:hypothetical protein|tara:strand:- start:4537 stop:4749 length:213 start_codon:yes stop_codon:yes gene_type:complete